MATVPHHDLEPEDDPVLDDQPVEPEMEIGMPALPEQEDEGARVPK